MKRKPACYIWAGVATVFFLVAIMFFMFSYARISDLPDEMALSKASGTLQSMDITKEVNGTSTLSLNMAHESGRVLNFGAIQIDHALYRFYGLLPGDKLEITYRVDMPGSPPQYRPGARLIQMLAEGKMIWSVDDSIEVSENIKFTQRVYAVLGLVIGLFSLAMMRRSCRKPLSDAEIKQQSIARAQANDRLAKPKRIASYVMGAIALSIFTCGLFFNLGSPYITAVGLFFVGLASWLRS